MEFFSGNCRSGGGRIFGRSVLPSTSSRSKPVAASSSAHRLETLSLSLSAGQKMEEDKDQTMVDANDPVTGHIISTTIGGKNGEPKRTISYMAERIVGTGSFGIVFQAKCIETGETVAIKKVLQDKRYKNRDLQLMRSMDHPNVVSLKHCFFSTISRDELFLNLVMEYVPESLYRVLKHYSSMNQRMPLIFVKLYTYQIFRGLAYIHVVPGVCHRDVKRQNVLVDPLSHQVKICDFGSAKILVRLDVASILGLLAYIVNYKFGTLSRLRTIVADLKRNYIFGGICSVAANASIKALSEMKSINLLGVQQICRNSIALEQALAAIPSIDSEAIQQRLDRVRLHERCRMMKRKPVAFSSCSSTGHLFRRT